MDPGSSNQQVRSHSENSPEAGYEFPELGCRRPRRLEYLGVDPISTVGRRGHDELVHEIGLPNPELEDDAGSDAVAEEVRAFDIELWEEGRRCPRPSERRSKGDRCRPCARVPAARWRRPAES